MRPLPDFFAFWATAAGKSPSMTLLPFGCPLVIAR
jgi:hypothetical protein